MKKKCVMLVWLILLVVGLSGCSEPEKADKFYIYSWDTELNERLEYVYAEYPEMRERICYVNLNGSQNYQTKLNQALSDPENEEYPDLFAMEAGYLEDYTQSDQTLAVTELGIGEEATAQMYPYTLEASLDQESGEQKALSWQACPGAFLYRRSLAREYLGTDDPQEVQEQLTDWNSFLLTGEKIKQESGGLTKIVASVDDISNVFWSNKQAAYVDENHVLTVDKSLYKLFEVSKVLQQKNLTAGETMWSDEWLTGGARDSVFGYFGSTWFLHWILKPNCGGEAPGEGTYGDWAICKGPQAYYWGGTWVGASKYCSDREFAGKIMYALTCDSKIMKAMSDGTLDYINNRKAMQELQAEGKGKYDFLQNQDFIEVFGPMAEQVDVSFMSPYDSVLNQLLLIQVHDYADGDINHDAAVSQFLQDAKEQYPELIVNQ